MRRFEFKLESLLNYKKFLEKMARQEMAKAVANINDCDQQIQTLKETKVTSSLKLEKVVEKGVGAQEFKLHHEFLAMVDQMIVDEKIRKTQLEKILDEKRSMLKKRTIDKKAMERLRERRSKEYSQEMIRNEQKELDEISSLKTAREIANGSQ